MIFVGDDWAEDHHDVYLVDEAGARPASRRLPEGMTGIPALHELIPAHLRGSRAGGGRDPDRPRAVGDRVGRGGLWGVGDQSDGPGAVPRPPPRLGGQIGLL